MALGPIVGEYAEIRAANDICTASCEQAALLIDNARQIPAASQLATWIRAISAVCQPCRRGSQRGTGEPIGSGPHPKLVPTPAKGILRGRIATQCLSGVRPETLSVAQTKHLEWPAEARPERACNAGRSISRTVLSLTVRPQLIQLRKRLDGPRARRMGAVRGSGIAASAKTFCAGWRRSSASIQDSYSLENANDAISAANSHFLAADLYLRHKRIMLKTLRNMLNSDLC